MEILFLVRNFWSLILNMVKEAHFCTKMLFGYKFMHSFTSKYLSTSGTAVSKHKTMNLKKQVVFNIGKKAKYYKQNWGTMKDFHKVINIFKIHLILKKSQSK